MLHCTIQSFPIGTRAFGTMTSAGFSRKYIVWYGAINILGYATEEDNVIKVVDNKLANELLEVLLTS